MTASQATAAPVAPIDPVADSLMTDLACELRREGRKPLTAQQYRHTLGQLAAFCPDHAAPGAALCGCPRPPLTGMTRERITAFIIALRETYGFAAASAETRFRHLRRFYNFALDEQVIDRSPMARMKQPKLPVTLTPVLADAQLAALLEAAAADKSYAGLRDHAIMRILCEAGTPRASELCALDLEHVNLTADLITIHGGKGDVDRIIPIGARTHRAISRYLRARAARPGAATCPALFTGVRTYSGGMRRLTRSGLLQILRERGNAAGVPGLHPHQFRHTSYHRLELAGGSSNDAQKLYGWKSAAMCAHYGASGAARRAVEHARTFAIGDTL
jgi:site-specific recombinase XerD